MTWSQVSESVTASKCGLLNRGLHPAAFRSGADMVRPEFP